MEWGLGKVEFVEEAAGSGLVLPALLPVFSEGSFPWEEAWEGLSQLHGIFSVCSWINQLGRSCSWQPLGAVRESWWKMIFREFFPCGTDGNCGVWPKDAGLDLLGSEQGFGNKPELENQECCWDWPDPQTWLFSGKNLSFLPFSTSKGPLESWSSAAASCPQKGSWVLVCPG